MHDRLELLAAAAKTEWRISMSKAEFDIVIRGGDVVDGTGARTKKADVAIAGDRIVAIGQVEGKGAQEIDATGKVVTPGFVDIHTHLDAQLAWDPIGSSSCWHGITSVVMGNCGVTFAPVKTEDISHLAEMMESVEDIPREAILQGLPWDWRTYGEYLSFLDGLPKGINVGGMVGHVAVRWNVMGEESLDEEPATAEQVAQMCDLVDEAIGAGALGFSTSRTLLHRTPDGRPIPGTFADDEELFAFADVLGRHGKGVFESAPRFEKAGADWSGLKHEIKTLGEVTRRSGRPSTFGLVYNAVRPDMSDVALAEVAAENRKGAELRPQTTCRPIGVVLGIQHRTPWARAGETWKSMQDMNLGERLALIRDSNTRRMLIEEANNPEKIHGGGSAMVDLSRLYLLDAENPDYRVGPEGTLEAKAAQAGVTPVEYFLAETDRSDGSVMLSLPILNQDYEAIETMMADEAIVMGLADAGAHVGQIMDSSQPTYFLSHWVRDTGFFTLEEGVRRITSDTADLFGLVDRGRIVEGAYADVNVIDFERLSLIGPEYVHDFPGGAGRYIQRGTGYDATIVNGKVFMEDGEHTGELAGVTLRSTD
ncbi:MAG: amidohydrolase family protein [Candidatus Poriferisodalaceae bacterium]|tara:strand:- start:21019 stop:22800 length:1782 start_codon:yes stop_codon:yes gene_type:complete